MKHDIAYLLGASTHATPALSTVLLVATGIAAVSWSLVIAAVLVAAGAAIASR